MYILTIPWMWYLINMLLLYFKYCMAVSTLMIKWLSSYWVFLYLPVYLLSQSVSFLAWRLGPIRTATGRYTGRYKNTHMIISNIYPNSAQFTDLTIVSSPGMYTVAGVPDPQVVAFAIVLTGRRATVIGRICWHEINTSRKIVTGHIQL